MKLYRSQVYSSVIYHLYIILWKVLLKLDSLTPTKKRKTYYGLKTSDASDYYSQEVGGAPRKSIRNPLCH